MIEIPKALKDEPFDTFFFLPGVQDDTIHLESAMYKDPGEKVGGSKMGDSYHIIIFREAEDGELVGASVSEMDGVKEGEIVGPSLGIMLGEVVGQSVGAMEEEILGLSDGVSDLVGDADGSLVGASVGAPVGGPVGDKVGARDGAIMGAEEDDVGSMEYG